MPGIAAKDLPRWSGDDRAGEWLVHLADPAELSWTTEKGQMVTLSSVAVDGATVAFHAHVLGADGKVVFDDGHAIVNPPIYVPDGGVDIDGEQTFVKNIREVLRDIVERNLR